MKTDTGQARSLEQRFHVAIGRVGIDGILRLHRVREYPLADGIRFAPPQNIDYAVRQDNSTHALIGLCLADGILTLPLTVEGTAHFQCTGVSVEVASLQTTDLAAAQAGHQLGLEEIPPHLVLLVYSGLTFKLYANFRAAKRTAPARMNRCDPLKCCFC